MGLLFENETCSRCGGSGQYSYCARWGTTCFKCQGSKVVLTKRGAIAQGYLDQLQTIAVQDLKLGALIEVTGVLGGGGLFTYKAPVVSIGPSNNNGTTTVGGVKQEPVECVRIKTEHAKYGAGGSEAPQDGTIRIWPNTAENIAKALKYQASLTKSGTVRKTKQNKGLPA